jgi:CRISPR system Cascade subunit CasD
MNTLLLRFSAPMQSWGIESNFTVRDSGLEPSKSGVIGLLCAALGWPRMADLADLSSLRMGLRVDREGTLQSDYQIAQNVLAADGKGEKVSIPSTRYYLADAVFLVGLESEDLPWLEQLDHALLHPVWTLYLGRKAFVPSAPVGLSGRGLRRGEALEVALRGFPWLVSWPREKAPAKVRLVVEDLAGEQYRNDVPVSFARREFIPRRVHTCMIAAPHEYLEEVENVPVETGA